MAEQIYDKPALQAKVVAHLQQHGRHQTSGQVALAVGAQLWAAEQALEDAYRARQVTFSAGIGWLAMPVVAAKPVAASAIDVCGPDGDLI